MLARPCVRTPISSLGTSFRPGRRAINVMEGVISRSQPLELVFFCCCGPRRRAAVCSLNEVLRRSPSTLTNEASPPTLNPRRASERGAQVSELKGEVSVERECGAAVNNAGGNETEGKRRGGERCRGNRAETEGSAVSAVWRHSRMLASIFLSTPHSLLFFPPRVGRAPRCPTSPLL